MNNDDLRTALRNANPNPDTPQFGQDPDLDAIFATVIARLDLVGEAGPAVWESITAPIEATPTEANTDEQLGDGPTVDYLQQRPDESDEPSVRKGWSGVVAAVAATILVVVGVVVVVGVAERDSGDVVTDQASSPTVADPVSPPQVANPGPSLTVVDSLGYR